MVLYLSASGVANEGPGYAQRDLKGPQAEARGQQDRSPILTTFERGNQAGWAMASLEEGQPRRVVHGRDVAQLGWSLRPSG